MKRTGALLVGLVGLVLCISGNALAQTKSENRSEKLEEHEYATVALIYNRELAALGYEALYPVCIVTPIGTNNDRLLRYLRHAGYPISNYHICYPPNGRFTPDRDYPHGMSIIIDNIHHTSKNSLDITVAIGDNTMHFQRDLGTTLRNGTYHFRLRENGEWELTEYTKKYDYRDKKEG